MRFGALPGGTSGFGLEPAPMRRNCLLLLLLTSAWAQAAPPDGKALYTTWCAGCHGPKGLGDGPEAKGFDSKPASLAAQSYKRGTSDKAVLKIITNGIAGTPMDSYGDKLGEDQRKALVQYLKVLRGQK
jgi:mono/diheme cytochrome c family protein